MASYNGTPAKFLSDISSCVAKPAMHLGTRRFVSKSRRFAIRNSLKAFALKSGSFTIGGFSRSKFGRFAMFASKSGCCLPVVVFLVVLVACDCG